MISFHLMPKTLKVIGNFLRSVASTGYLGWGGGKMSNNMLADLYSEKVSAFVINV